MADTAGREVLLVGSVPLTSSEEVFTCCAAALGSRVRRLPDGETGERSHWINWQRNRLQATPWLEKRADGFHIRPGQGGAFGPLGYAEAALASFATFERLQGSGAIPPGTRFQVSLPTPLAVVARYVALSSQAEAEPPYERALLAELATILAAIPHGRLSLQWDVAIEFAVLEGLRPVAFAPVYEGVIDRLLRLCAAVPADVELGMHLCYGDAGHKHFKEPDDTALLVRVANDVAARSEHALAWIHLPVPRSRDDAAYFRPLAGLQLPAGTQLFLGLVHATDGAEGTRRRIAAAEPFAPAFGIGTECGFGRRDPQTIPGLLDLHLHA